MNRTIGDPHDWRTLAARTAKLGDGHPKRWDGADCVSDYVSQRIDEAGTDLAEYLASAGAPEDRLGVVVTFPVGGGLDRTAVLCALAEREGITRPVEITASGVQKVSGGSPIEAALNSQAPGSIGWDDFVDVRKLRSKAAAGDQILVEHKGERWVAISAEEIQLHRSRALMLHLSPFV